MANSPGIWIRTISETEAEGALAELYAARRRATGRLGNRFKALSLWPELLAIREEMEMEVLDIRGARREGREFTLSLGARRREMLVVVTAALIGCHF